MAAKDYATGAGAATALPGRDFSIDLLKTLAIIGVITIHTCTGWAAGIGSFGWLSNLFWGVLTRASVPIFLMCSGALMLGEQRHFSLKKLYTKNLARIFAAMYFWGMAYKVFRLVLGKSLTLVSLFHAMKQVLLFNHEFHLYYLHIIIIVYIFLPITRVFTGSASKRQLEYFLAVWFVFGILYPTVKGFWPFTLISGIPTQWLINMTYASIGYGVLAHYLKRFHPNRPKIYFPMFATGFAFVFAGTWIMTAWRGTLYQGFLEGMSVGVALMAAGLFGLCLSARANPGSPAARAAAYVSRASFCIYLVHIFFSHLFTKIGLTIGLMPYIFSIPIVVAANLACSTAVYCVLSRVPAARRWLI